MRFLLEDSQWTFIGYPILILYLVAAIGFALILIRPYWAFLFSVFCLAGRNYHAAVFTRLSFAGPYLNLNDLLLWIAVFSMLAEIAHRKRKLIAPGILVVIVVLIFIGDLQSVMKYGLITQVLRRLWSTAVFPVLFLAAANMVNNGKQASQFFWAMVAGTTMAATQHMAFLGHAFYLQFLTGGAQFRTISYIMSGGLFLLIAELSEPSERKAKRKVRWLRYAALSVIGLSYVMSLTRGLYIYALISLLVFPFILRGRFVLSKKVVLFGILFIGIMIAVQIILPGVGLSRIVSDRLGTFDTRDEFVDSYRTRLAGLRTELDIWMNDSPWILGVGSSLSPEYETATEESTGSLYHVGATTYLAHYGIIGLLIFGLMLPFGTIKIARFYYFSHVTFSQSRIALIAIAASLMDLVGLAWSHDHLTAKTQISGLVYGAIWGLYLMARVEKRVKHRQVLRAENAVMTGASIR